MAIIGTGFIGSSLAKYLSNHFNVDIKNTLTFFGVEKLKSPKEMISQIVKKAMRELVSCQ